MGLPSRRTSTTRQCDSAGWPGWTRASTCLPGRSRPGCTFPQRNEQDFDKKNWKLDKSEARREERIKFNRQGITPISAAPFQAVDLLFDNLDQWTCDCRLFGELAMLFAWHEALADSPVAFNNKFANLVLTPETTTGLEREVIVTDPAAVLEDPKLDINRLWKEAPVGDQGGMEERELGGQGAVRV